MTTFSQVISDGYKFLGGVTTEQLPLPLAVLHAHTALTRRHVKLQLSDRSHLLDSFDLPADGINREFEITESDFGEAVLVQYSDDGGLTFRGNIQEVNKANLYLSQENGEFKFSLWGNPKMLEFSHIPAATYVFRVYYEPHGRTAPKLSTNVDLNNNSFLKLLSIEWALNALEDVAGVDEDWRLRKRESLINQKQEWEADWEKWISKPSVQGVVRKRLYTSGRRRL